MGPADVTIRAARSSANTWMKSKLPSNRVAASTPSGGLIRSR